MSAIVPRWEWRAFGERVGAADARLVELTPERVHDSEELYVLSRRSDDVVKVRHGLMDVKHLQRVNEDGLEQWLPVMKAAFPLGADDVGSVLGTLRVPDPVLGRAAYTLDELLDEVVGPNDDLLAVTVHKRRRRYTLGGCMAELTDVRADGRVTRTVAVESEDAARVAELVRELGLEPLPNVSFPRGLRALVGFGVERVAVVDVGTSSVKFHVAERVDGRWRTVVDRSEVTRLGEGLDAGGRLEAAPIERTVDAIATMADEARDHGAVEIAAVGTAGLRIASNSASFLASVRDRTGIQVEVISGEEEARLAYLAVRAELGSVQGSLVVFETGGGSSQFTFGHAGGVDEQFSVDVGAARFTERFGLDRAVSEDVIASAHTEIAAELEGLDGRPVPGAVVAIGGAVTNLAAVKHALVEYDPDVVRGTVLDLLEIDRQIELYRTRTAEERRQIVGLQPKRAEVILAGACIVRAALGKLGRESLTVSDRGLRHGLLLERFGL